MPQGRGALRISFHEDTVVVVDLCQDLREHGAVYWHTSRPNFSQVAQLIRDAGVGVIPMCARPGGDFLSFLVRTDLVGNDMAGVAERAAVAIMRWQEKGEPVPHLERL